MSKITYDFMEEYLRGLVSNHNEVLTDLEEYATINHVPIVTKEVSRFLEVMVSIKKPKKILELGTAIGYSSILMSMASNRRAHITSIERDEAMILKANENIENLGFKDEIKVLQGDCLEVMKTLEGEFDLIFMDAGKGHYNDFLKECMRLLSKDGIIIADNVLFRGMVASDELVIRRKITIVKRMRKFLEDINKDNSLLATILPMGDGIAIITRRENHE